MNIWYLSAHDQPRGRSSRTYDYARELVRRGHRVTMFTNSYCHWTHEELLAPGEKWRIEVIDGIRVVWLRTIHYTGNGLDRGLNMVSNVWQTLRVARRLPDKPEVVIGPSVPIGTGWAGLKIAQKTGAAFVYEVRDVWPIALVDDGGLSRNSPVYHIFRHLEKKLYRKAQRISATMPFIHQHVAESGSDPKKVSWMPNGVMIDRFNGYQTYQGGTKLPLVAMYIGGFGVAHDVISIVRAAGILQDRGVDDYRFIIIGDGVKKAECQQEASALGLRNLEFRDPVKKADIPELQMQSDILIACVTDSESYRFGLNLNKLFDYFASSRPVIFSGNAPNDPVLESGAGYTTQPENPESMADALQSYLALSPAQRVEMGNLGRNYVESEYDMSVLGERMESLFLAAIGDRG